MTVICFHPHPATTQGEARAVTKLARTHNWRQIIVVPGIPQTTRARIRFDRCYHGTLFFDPASPGGPCAWIHNVFYEWGALAKAADSATWVLARQPRDECEHLPRRRRPGSGWFLAGI